MSFELRKLEDVCDILDHIRIPITSRDRKDGPYPYYGANGIQDYIDDYIFDDDLVLLAEDGGNFGSKEKPIAYRISGKTWVNNHAHVLKPKNIIDVDYLCYSLMYYDVSGLVNGATRQKLTQSEMRKINIRYRSLEKQRQIVFKIKLVSNIISSREHQLSNLNLLVKSRFIEMFGDPKSNPKGWNKKTLSEIITKANNGMARRGNDESGSIVLRLVELQGGFIDYSKPNRIILTEKEQEKYLLQENDILFARVNGNPLNVGRCAVFHTIDEAVYHNDHIIRVHFDDSLINGVFASNILNSEYGKDQLKNKIKTSAGQYTISQDGIGAIESIMPPIELQNQYADFVAQVDKSKLAIQQSLDELETLKKSLMQQYFG